MEPSYLTVQEVADILRKNPKWVYTNKEKIPGYFKLAGSILFDQEILDEHIKKVAVKPANNPKNSAFSDRHGLLK